MKHILTLAFIIASTLTSYSQALGDKTYTFQSDCPSLTLLLGGEIVESFVLCDTRFKSVSSNVFSFTDGVRTIQTQYRNTTFADHDAAHDYLIAQQNSCCPVVGQIDGSSAIVTKQRAMQVTPPPEGKTAFGEALIAQMMPLVNIHFAYSVSPNLLYKRENQSGTITQATGMAVLSTGAAANSSAEIRTKHSSRYVPGQGISSRFTSMFTTGVANSTQYSGSGNESDGFFFGYQGADFGILHRKAGAPEIRTLTIDTKSSTAEDITITLDSDAEATVTVTNGADKTVTANEIAAHDFSDVGRGWDAIAHGEDVIFVSWNDTPKAGTYTLSSATTAVGTFAQTESGLDPTETFIIQANWNGTDIFDGNGITGETLDPTKGNVYQIKYQWLGFGGITFYIESSDGEFHLVHTIEYANSNITPSLYNPSLPLSIIVENTSNTSDIIVKSSSIGAFAEGMRLNDGIQTGVKSSTNIAGSSEVPILTIKARDVFNGAINRGKLKLNLLSVSCEHTKPVLVNFYGGASTVASSWVNVDAADSIIEYDVSATSFSGGKLLFSIALAKSDSELINLLSGKLIGVFEAGESLTITAEPLSGTGAEVEVGINLTEYH